MIAFDDAKIFTIAVDNFVDSCVKIGAARR